MSIKIGFSNLDERNTFAREMREHLEQSVSNHEGAQLIVRDNQHDTDIAIANSKEFAELGVDAAIIYHIDERAGVHLTTPLREQRIPIIAVEFRLPHALFIGIDNEAIGTLSGNAGGEWIRNNWSSEVDKIAILTDQRVISVHRARFISALSAFLSHTSRSNIEPLWVDSGTETHVAKDRFADLLQDWENTHKIAVITMGDVVSQGAIEAARSVNRENDICVMSFDGTEWAQNEFMQTNSRLISSPKFNLPVYADKLVELAMSAANNKVLRLTTLVEPIQFARE